MAYTVKPGDTLYSLYGPNWKQLSGYAGDPTKLQIGTQLPDLPTQPAPGIAPQAPTSPVQPQTTQFPNLSPTAPNQAVLDIKTNLEQVLADLKTKQDLLVRAEASGFGVGTGKEIPGFVETAKTPEEAKAIAEAPISAPIAEPKREERIGELEGEVFTPTTTTWQDIYKQAYEQSGLDKAKTSIEAIDVKINKARDDLVAAEAGITENPWLHEQGRQGRIRTLYELAEKQISNLLSQREQLWTGYQSGISQVERVATQTMNELETGRKLKAEELDYLTSLRQSKGTPQLKQIATGEFAWIYPDGTIIKTGEKGLVEEKVEGLTPAQINTTVNSIASAFDNEPIVKEFNTINAQYNFLKTAGNTPTDDISRVYVFAKVMDPNSVVREGEYKTVQDYSQALFEKLGLKAKRVFDNAGFLTSEARTFMENTIKRRITVAETQYKQVASEYQRQINDALAGKPRTITEYRTTFETPTSNLRETVISMGYDYDSMSKNYSDEEIKKALGL